MGIIPTFVNGIDVLMTHTKDVARDVAREGVTEDYVGPNLAIDCCCVLNLACLGWILQLLVRPLLDYPAHFASSVLLDPSCIFQTIEP